MKGATVRVTAAATGAFVLTAIISHVAPWGTIWLTIGEPAGQYLLLKPDGGGWFVDDEGNRLRLCIPAMARAAVQRG